MNRIDQPPDTSATSLLDLTLAEAVRDQATVTAAGVSLARPLDGMISRPSPTHVDERGSLVEMFDPRWNVHPDPLVYAYTFTIRPGYAKGWNLHKLHEDRYFLLQGEMELVLYDVRPDSSTCGQIYRLTLSEHDRRLVNIPKYVWHTDRNIGTCDAVVVNFPTMPYDHANPDKYRLPLDTPLIPYKFVDVRGW
jgi:dTDP-4-dehydrorhamnose 3,5-epimerase